jgi:hypothetical protein
MELIPGVSFLCISEKMFSYLLESYRPYFSNPEINNTTSNIEKSTHSFQEAHINKQL